MRKNGWYGDSWRHGLAAQGVKTRPVMKPSNYLMKKYFAAPNEEELSFIDAVSRTSGTGGTGGAGANVRIVDIPEARTKKEDAPDITETLFGGVIPSTRIVLEEEKAKKMLENFKKQEAVDKTLFGILKADFQEGDFSEIEQMNELNAVQKRALQQILSQQALQQVQSGLDVPQDVIERLPPVIQSQINAIQKQQAIETESTSKRLTKRALVEGAAGVEEAFAEGLETIDIGGDASKSFVRGATDFRTNPIIGNQEDEELGKQFAEGAFNPFANDFGGELSQPLSETFTPKTKIAPIDFGLGRTPDKKQVERVQEEVDSLFNARNDLGKVSDSGFQKGKSAFNRGDREALLDAINEIDFEVEKQRNRWDMVEQARSIVTSPSNRQAIMNDTKSFSLWSSGGGKKIADQTDKINEVKQSIKKGADKARARSFNLRQKLMRLDTQVEPEQSLPKNKIDVFGDRSAFPMQDVGRDVGKFMFGEKKDG